jgi:hypothetical protein
MVTFKESLKVILFITGFWRINKSAIFLPQATQTTAGANAGSLSFSIGRQASGVTLQCNRRQTLELPGSRS